MGRALHQNGVPSHRLESALERVSRSLGLDGSYFSTPTALFVSLQGKTHLLRVDPGEVDLGRMYDLDVIADAVIEGDIDEVDGAAKVSEVLAAPPRYGLVLSLLAFLLASATAAPFMGGGLYDAAIAGACGLVTGGLHTLSERVEAIGRLFVPLAAFCCSLLTQVAATQLALQPETTLVAGLIVLVPGLTLTTAISELASGHLASGTARFMAAAMSFLTMGVGVALGLSLGGALAVDPMTAVIAPLPGWVSWTILPFAALAFLVLFKARLADLPWIIIAGYLAIGCAYFGNLAIGPALSAFAGAAGVAIFANGFARFRKRPAATVLVPGLILLVPGSLGFAGVTAMLGNDTIGGIESVVSMLFVAGALVAGILVANVVVPPVRSL
ncbi:MAG: uncharacterized membrane protein YjjP (DUF1212 family) [Myxococcota bacterium]